MQCNMLEAKSQLCKLVQAALTGGKLPLPRVALVEQLEAKGFFVLPCTAELATPFRSQKRTPIATRVMSLLL